MFYQFGNSYYTLDLTDKKRLNKTKKNIPFPSLDTYPISHAIVSTMIMTPFELFASFGITNIVRISSFLPFTFSLLMKINTWLFS